MAADGCGIVLMAIKSAVAMLKSCRDRGHMLRPLQHRCKFRCEIYEMLAM